MKYQVVVEMKEGVLDPEMSTLQKHLQLQGDQGILQILQKKVYEITFSSSSQEEAEKRAHKLAEEYFANPEIHSFRLHLMEEEPGSTGNLRVSCIDHINLNVINLRESVNFYHQLFGFEIKKDQSSEEEKSQIIGNESVKLCLYEEPQKARTGGINHFGFHVKNFESVLERCRELKVPMPYGIIEWEKSRSVYIVDPNGYELELSEVVGGGL